MQQDYICNYIYGRNSLEDGFVSHIFGFQKNVKVSKTDIKAP